MKSVFDCIFMYQVFHIIQMLNRLECVTTVGWRSETVNTSFFDVVDENRCQLSIWCCTHTSLQTFQYNKMCIDDLLMQISATGRVLVQMLSPSTHSQSLSHVLSVVVYSMINACG